MPRIVLAKHVDVFVGSYGGVGTTFLIDFIRQYRNVNDRYDAEGIKHSPLPPISFNRSAKFIYVYGDPRHAAVSLFRRGYHNLQSIKLLRWRVGAKPIPKSQTLAEYLEAGVDRFHFRDHFYNWHDRYLPSMPTMFIRYETLFEHVDEIISFLELPSESAAAFPAKRARAAEQAPLDPDIAAGLNAMYGAFSDELSKFADVEVRCNPRLPRFMPSRHLRGMYRRALWEHGALEFRKGVRTRFPRCYSFARRVFNR